MTTQNQSVLPPTPAEAGEVRAPELRSIDGFGAFLRVLNEAYKADHAAILALIENRVLCNDALADHPTIQVRARANGETEVGMLGVINGICEAATGKRVAVCISDSGEITGFIEYVPNTAVSQPGQLPKNT